MDRTLVILTILATINYPFVWLVELQSKRPGVRPIYALSASREQIKAEHRNSLLSTPSHAIVLGLALWSRALQPSHETIVTFISTALLVFVWTEIWHYASHLAMHTRRLHFLHRIHHASRITNPWSAVSFSLGEKLIFSGGVIGLMSLLSHWIPISIYGITAYYILYFYTNALGHANIEIRRPRYAETWPGKFFNTPAYHAMHHARYIGNYGLMTPLLDKLFGTYWNDSSHVQTRAAIAQPLMTLKERVYPAHDQ